MKVRKSYTKTQIKGYLEEVKNGATVAAVAKKHGFSDSAFYSWRAAANKQGKQPSQAQKLTTAKSSTKPVGSVKATTVRRGRRSVAEMPASERRHALYQKQGDILGRFDFSSALIALNSLDRVSPHVTIRDLKDQAGATVKAAIESNKDNSVVIQDDKFGFEATNVQNKSVELRLILAK